MRNFIFLLLVCCPALSFAYDRGEWRHRVDQDLDCLDTRQEVLIRDSLIPPEFNSEGCRVISGLWVGPYTGIVFTNPRKLHIDHVVPLKWANDHGAAGWSPLLKELFANDLENLLAVEARQNMSKGSKSVSEYLPPFTKGQRAIHAKMAGCYT